ncbi:MAG: hypothetical protein B6A08_02800 [Sorangiineae bacterium NIC37A_2]|jgi:hypothetical protein|nr:MAG: hypothetical protein B6A08_02800 [Sorangiineae bacterium NIC37A_2]
MSRNPEAKSSQTMEGEGNSSQDIVIVHGRTEDQQGLKVLRARPERVELGEVRPLKEGQAIFGDIVQLKPRAGAPWICDVETQFSYSQNRSGGEAPRESAPRHPGPARVATDAYRQNWDAIWNRGSSDLN